MEENAIDYANVEEAVDSILTGLQQSMWPEIALICGIAMGVWLIFLIIDKIKSNTE